MSDAAILEKLAGPFTQSVLVHAPIERVRAAWTTPEGLTGFFLGEALAWDADGNPQPHLVAPGRYRWVWRGGEADEGTVFRAEPNFIEVGWFEDAGRVTIQFSQEGGHTKVTLTETMEQPADNIGERIERQLACREGWAFFLTNLKAYLEHGIDLRAPATEPQEGVNH